jgi:toxin FitB
MIILDTNVISDVMQVKGAVATWLDGQPRSSVWTTAIAVFEIRCGLEILTKGKRRSEQEAAFERLIGEKLEGRILVFDQAAADEAALLMARRHLAGTPRDLRDTMIARISLAQRATLATRNVRHFDDLSVPVVNPWEA